MNETRSGSGNPAERPDVEIYRPRRLTNVKYDAANNMVTDLDTGNRLSVSHGHAGGPSQYGFSNEKTGLIAYGGYRDSGGATYTITTLKTEHATGAPYRARSEFDVSCMVELFRARWDAVLSHVPDGGDTMVVDSRPATPNDINPRTGMPKDKV